MGCSGSKLGWTLRGLLPKFPAKARRANGVAPTNWWASSADDIAVGDTIVGLTDRAVHPLFLAAVAQLEVVINGKKVKLGDLKTFEVVKDFIKPATEHTGKCLVETVAAMIMEKNMGEEMKLAAHDPAKGQMNKGAFEESLDNMMTRYMTWAGGNKPFHGPVTYFLSHAWGYKFGDLANMAKQHYEMVTGTQYKYEPVFYWVDIFSVAQNFDGDFKRHPDGKFPAVIQVSKGVVFTIYPWNQPIAPSRIWCLFEAVTAVELGVNLELLIETEFSNAKQALPQLRQKFDTMIAELDVGQAQASVESDRLSILDMLSKRPGGISGFNTIMRDLLSSRMLGLLLLRALGAQDAKQAATFVQQGAAFDFRVQKFPNVRLTDSSMDAISKAMAQSKHNRSLDLSPRNGGGFLTGRGIVTLAGVLKTDTRLRALDLSNHPKLGDEGIDALVAALGPGGNTSLRTLCLGNTGIDDASAAALGTMLRTNSSLHTLKLPNNSRMHSSGLRKLFVALELNSSLRTLDLTANKLGDPATCAALAGLLERNSALQRLVLRSCGISASGCERLSQGLLKNTSVKLLDLSCNPGIGDEGVRELAPLIESNQTLEALVLKECGLSRTGGELLLKLLLGSKLLHLDLRENKQLKRHHWDGMVDPASAIGTVVSLDQDDSQRDKSQPSTPCWIPRDAHVTNILRKQQSGKSASSRRTSFAPGAAGKAAGSDDDDEGTGAGRLGSGQMNGLESLEGMPMAAASLMLNSAIGSTSGTARTFSRHKLTVGMLQDGVLERHVSQDGHLRTPAPSKKSVGGGLWGNRAATVAGSPTKLPRIPGVTFAGGTPADPPRSRTLPGIFSRA